MKLARALFPLAYLAIGLLGAVLMFALPIYTLWDRLRGDGHAVTRAEIVMLTAFLGARIFVWAFADTLIRQVEAERGDTAQTPPKANPVNWIRTGIYLILIMGCIVFS